MIKSKIISQIYLTFIKGPSKVYQSKDELKQLIGSIIEINYKLWKLEDSARMEELGAEHVAAIKKRIDQNNQIRNNFIRDIDIKIVSDMKIKSFCAQEQFYSESPGMILDRLAILFIKLSVIRELLSIIKESNLKKEYKKKETMALKQVKCLNYFLDSYFNKLKKREIFFEVQYPIKIYNDSRVKKYLKMLKGSK